MTYRLRSFALASVLAMSLAWTFDSVPVSAAPPMRYDARVVDGRQILASDGVGLGRVVEAFGDIGSAEHIAIFVPGCSWSLANFTRRHDPMSPRTGARELLAEARRQSPGSRVAAVAWLGYEPPGGIDVDALRSERAIVGAPELARLAHYLPADAHKTLICHSYGSVVCGRAAAAAKVDDIVVVGATGMDASHASELGTTARIWATRADDDGMRFLPELRVAGFGHGTAPTSPDFGARVFDAGDARGHSGYYRPRGDTLRNITSIVLGEYAEVDRV